MVKRGIAIGVVAFVLLALFAVMAPVRAEAQLMKDYMIHYVYNQTTQGGQRDLWGDRTWRAASETLARQGFTASMRTTRGVELVRIFAIHLVSSPNNCPGYCLY